MNQMNRPLNEQPPEAQDQGVQINARINGGQRSSERPDWIDPRMPCVEYRNPLTPPEYFIFGNRINADLFVEFVARRTDHRFTATILS
jgi:hypothetical protein